MLQTGGYSVRGCLFVSLLGDLSVHFQDQIIFRRAVASAGWQHKHFISHSFRIGVAASVAALGFRQRAVQTLGHG